MGRLQPADRCVSLRRVYSTFYNHVVCTHECHVSPLSSEATGFGVVYFTEHMMKDMGKKLEGARCLLSGAGNVALYCAKKVGLALK